MSRPQGSKEPPGPRERFSGRVSLELSFYDLRRAMKIRTHFKHNVFMLNEAGELWTLGGTEDCWPQSFRSRLEALA